MVALSNLLSCSQSFLWVVVEAVVGSTASPQKIGSNPNSWYLWKRPYLEIGFLQMKQVETNS